MAIIATGIDLAKNVFAVHGVDRGGVVQLRQPKVGRAKLNALMAALPPTVIGMEACSGAHYWAREFQALWHTVRFMAPNSASRAAINADEWGRPLQAMASPRGTSPDGGPTLAGATAGQGKRPLSSGHDPCA